MLFNLQHILQPLHWRQRFHQGEGRLFFRNSKLSTLQICMKEGIFLSLKNIFYFVKEVPPKVAHILGEEYNKGDQIFLHHSLSVLFGDQKAVCPAERLDAFKLRF